MLNSVEHENSNPYQINLKKVFLVPVIAILILSRFGRTKRISVLNSDQNLKLRVISSEHKKVL